MEITRLSGDCRCSREDPHLRVACKIDQLAKRIGALLMLLRGRDATAMEQSGKVEIEAGSNRPRPAHVCEVCNSHRSHLVADVSP